VNRFERGDVQHGQKSVKADPDRAAKPKGGHLRFPATASDNGRIARPLPRSSRYLCKT
jgi:hypothetical protein